MSYIFLCIAEWCLKSAQMNIYWFEYLSLLYLTCANHLELQITAMYDALKQGRSKVSSSLLDVSWGENPTYINIFSSRGSMGWCGLWISACSHQMSLPRWKSQLTWVSMYHYGFKKMLLSYPAGSCVCSLSLSLHLYPKYFVFFSWFDPAAGENGFD